MISWRIPIESLILFVRSYCNRFIMQSNLFFVVPGGTLSQEGDGPPKTDACIFNTPDEINMEEMKNWEQVFIKLMRRYKYLEKIFQVSITFICNLLYLLLNEWKVMYLTLWEEKTQILLLQQHLLQSDILFC